MIKKEFFDTFWANKAKKAELSVIKATFNV